MSSIDWICSESTIRPIFAISSFDPSRTSVASFCRSVMISSTVIEPMIERRWPAKMRPVRIDIWSWSDRKRCPALTMVSGSLPTLNAMTALTFSEMPCLVTQVSATSDSNMARVRKFDLAEERQHERAVPGHDLERRAVPAVPCRRRSAWPRRAPGRGSRTCLISTDGVPITQISRARLVAGERIGPGADVDGPVSSFIDDKDRRALRQWLRGPGDERLRATRIWTRTSPGPASPRVATMIFPMQPMAETFATTRLLNPLNSRVTSSLRVVLRKTAAGRRNTPPGTRVTSSRRCVVSPGPNPLPARTTVRLEPR